MQTLLYLGPEGMFLLTAPENSAVLTLPEAEDPCPPTHTEPVLLRETPL